MLRAAISIGYHVRYIYANLLSCSSPLKSLKVLCPRLKLDYNGFLKPFADSRRFLRRSRNNTRRNKSEISRKLWASKGLKLCRMHDPNLNDGKIKTIDQKRI